MFAPAWATERMPSSDVMDSIGEMPRHTDVNGRRTICQDRILHSPSDAGRKMFLRELCVSA